MYNMWLAKWLKSDWLNMVEMVSKIECAPDKMCPDGHTDRWKYEPTANTFLSWGFEKAAIQWKMSTVRHWPNLIYLSLIYYIKWDTFLGGQGRNWWIHLSMKVRINTSWELLTVYAPPPLLFSKLSVLSVIQCSPFEIPVCIKHIGWFI